MTDRLVEPQALSLVELRDHCKALVRRSATQSATLSSLTDALHSAQDRSSALQTKLHREGSAGSMAMAALSDELQHRDTEITRLNLLLQVRDAHMRWILHAALG